MNPVSLQIEEHPTDDDLRQLVNGVRSYNRALTGHDRPRAVASILRDEEGNIVGGAHGELWGASVHIAAMWVAESHRGKGYGSALLTAVEEYAAKHGNLLSYLETTSFQARPFYERLGYTVFGELWNRTRVHAVLSQKRLDGSQPRVRFAQAIMKIGRRPFSGGTNHGDHILSLL